jgi:DNA mismatch repair protein MSH5
VVRAELYETEEEVQDREDSDAINEVIMAVDLKDPGTVGCAYYIARDEKLCLMEDIKMAGLDIVDTLKVHIQPTTILISTRSEEKLEEHLSKDARGIERGGEASKLEFSASYIFSDRHPLDDIFGAYVLDARPSPEFSSEGAKSKLVGLDLAADNGLNIAFTTPGDAMIGDASMGRQGRLMRLAGWIDLDSEVTVWSSLGSCFSKANISDWMCRCRSTLHRTSQEC